MRVSGPRLTVRRLMIMVVFGALCSAVCRYDPAIGSFAAGASCLGLIRTFQRIDRSGAAGSPMTLPRRLATLLASLAVASAILVASGLPALAAFDIAYACTPAGRRCGRPTEVGAYAIPLVVAAMVALPSARLVKRAWW